MGSFQELGLYDHKLQQTKSIYIESSKKRADCVSWNHSKIAQ